MRREDGTDPGDDVLTPLPLGPLSPKRGRGPLCNLELLVEVAAFVAHPKLIHLGPLPRHDPHNLLVIVVKDRIAVA